MVFEDQSMRQEKYHVKKFIVGTRFRVGLLLLTVGLMTCHVVKMSTVATHGYQISQLQKQLHALEDEKQKIDIDVASLSSMTSIQERMKQTEYIPIEKPQYIIFHGSSVVQR